MALKMIFLSIKRCSYIQWVFIRLLLSSVVWLSLEIEIRYFNALAPLIHISTFLLDNSQLFPYFRGNLIHIHGFSHLLYADHFPNYITCSKLPWFLTSCPLETPPHRPDCPTRYFKLKTSQWENLSFYPHLISLTYSSPLHPVSCLGWDIIICPHMYLSTDTYWELTLSKVLFQIFRGQYSTD